MKKRIIIGWFLTVLLGSTTGFAQLYVGPKVGVNMSKIVFQDKDNYDLYSGAPKLGYQAGVAATLNIKDNFSIQGEFGFAQKGKRVKGKRDPYLDHKASYNYLEMPLMFRLKFHGQIRKKDFEWFLSAGPNVSYWLSGSGKLKVIHRPC